MRRSPRYVDREEDLVEALEQGAQLARGVDQGVARRSPLLMCQDFLFGQRELDVEECYVNGLLQVVVGACFYDLLEDGGIGVTGYHQDHRLIAVHSFADAFAQLEAVFVGKQAVDDDERSESLLERLPGRCHILTECDGMAA